MHRSYLRTFRILDHFLNICFFWFVDGREGEALEVAEEVDGGVDVTVRAPVGVTAEETGAHVVRVGERVDDRLGRGLGVVLEVGRELTGAARNSMLKAGFLWRLDPVGNGQNITYGCL